MFEEIIQKTHGDIFVTLTFAQSIDGSIGQHDSQLLLSCPESMKLTHTLRNNRDAIMVGIGTILNDNPSLTTRLEGKSVNNPIPVIIDRDLSTPIDAKFMTFSRKRKPILICSKEAVATPNLSQKVEILRLPTINNRIDLEMTITELYRIGLKSVMIEGGARIIENCLTSNLKINELIITISPRIVSTGIRVFGPHAEQAKITLDRVKWHTVGQDCILSAQVIKHLPPF